MGKLRITQRRSTIGETKEKKDTLIALGLRGIGQTVKKDDNPAVRGMISKVDSLVEIEELSNDS